MCYVRKPPGPSFFPMAIRSQTRILRPLLSLFHNLSSSKENSNDDTLVSTAVSIIRSQRRKSRWNKLKSILPPSGITPSQSSSIILHLRNTPHLALRFFLWSLHLSLCPQNLSSFSTIIHILARSRLRSPALSLLRSAIRSHSPSSLLQTLTLTYLPSHSTPLVFNLLIQSYLHSNNLVPALSILRSLPSHPLLTSTANSILRAATNRLGSANTLLLYRDLVPTFRPNSQTFNALLLALYRDERAEFNGEILAEMGRFECRPNALTYSIRMAGCNEIVEARRLWGEMVGKGIRPDVTAYNTMIKRCCDAGEVGEGEEVWREMVRGGVEATGTTMGILVRGHFRVGRVGEAMRVYGEMRRKGMGVEMEVVEEMVEGLCEKGMVDEGLRVLKGEMGREEGVVVGGCRRSYEVVIEGLCGSGRMEEAAKLQAEMAGRGLEADARVYEAFVCGYERAGEWEMAEKLREEMLHFGGR